MRHRSSSRRAPAHSIPPTSRPRSREPINSSRSPRCRTTPACRREIRRDRWPPLARGIWLALAALLTVWFALRLRPKSQSPGIVHLPLRRAALAISLAAVMFGAALAGCGGGRQLRHASRHLPNHNHSQRQRRWHRNRHAHHNGNDDSPVGEVQCLWRNPPAVRPPFSFRSGGLQPRSSSATKGEAANRTFVKVRHRNL